LIPCFKYGRRILLLLTIGSSLLLQGQGKTWTWDVLDDASLPSYIEKDFAGQQFESREQLEPALLNFINALHNEGFFAASIDSTFETDDAYQSKVYRGPAFENVHLDLSDVDPLVLSKTGLGRLNSTLYSLPEIQDIIERILTYKENNGYPFAFASLEPQYIDGDEMRVALRLDENYPVKVDSIDMIGNLKLNKGFLQQYIRIAEGDLYSERDIRDISRRINELPFLEEVRPAQIKFRSNSARIKMYLNKKNASRFNFVLGLLPDDETGRLQITGDGLVHIVNGFGIGEELRLEYKNFPNSLQEVQTHVGLPYLPYVPVGVELGLNVVLRDTLHRDVDSDIAIYYNLSRNGQVKFFWQRNETRLLSINEAQIIAGQTSPELLDLTTNYYGVGFNWSRLDYKFNPRRGRNISVNFALGSRRIFENSVIRTLIEEGETEFDPYVGLRLRSTQLKADWLIQQFVPIKKRATFLAQYTGELTRNLFEGADDLATNYYQNEQFRIGGNRVLRGFDEESIFTDMYHLLTLEYRYLLSRNSYFFLFSDNAFLTDLTDPLAELVNFNYGFGTGFSFETKAGIFGISYALGGSRSSVNDDLIKNPPRFRNGKIHFGYVSYF